MAMAASTKTLIAEEGTLNGEWTVVSSRRGKQRKIPSVTKTLVEKQQQQPWAPADVEISFVRESKLMRKIQICLKKMEMSQFFSLSLDQVETLEMMDCIHRVLNSKSKMKMVIYGIGSIESYESPRQQLSLAILLKRRFNWIGDVEVFDPILSSTESRVLEALGCSVLSINEQGRREVQEPTLFFMPHCEAELYDNLLQANWGVRQLNCVVLFGNSFETYEQHQLEFKNSAIINSTRNILAVRRFTNEFKIKTVSNDYFGAFHDSSWHFFSPVLDTELQYIVLLDLLRCSVCLCTEIIAILYVNGILEASKTGLLTTVFLQKFVSALDSFRLFLSNLKMMALRLCPSLPDLLCRVDFCLKFVDDKGRKCRREFGKVKTLTMVKGSNKVEAYSISPSLNLIFRSVKSFLGSLLMPNNNN